MDCGKETTSWRRIGRRFIADIATKHLSSWLWVENFRAKRFATTICHYTSEGEIASNRKAVVVF